MKIKYEITNRQRGFTMIEILSVLIIIAMVAVVVGAVVNRGADAGNQRILENDIAMLRVAANEWRGLATNFTGVSCDILVEDEYITAPAWGGSCSSVNPMDGNYTVAAASPTTSVSIGATNLGEAFCNRAARSLGATATSASCSSGTLTVVYDR